MPLINSAFAAATVEEIQERLVAAAGSSSVAARSLEALQRASPTSLKLALRQIRTGATLPTLAACLNMEYRYRCLHLPGPPPQILLCIFYPSCRNSLFKFFYFFKDCTSSLFLLFLRIKHSLPALLCIRLRIFLDRTVGGRGGGGLFLKLCL
jgi:hypothetical protein